MKSTPLFLVATLSCLFSVYFCQAQVQTARYNSVNSNCGGYYEYLPQGYNGSSQSYPLIVFVHGLGELGNGTSDLGNILNCWTALPRLIANGSFPTSFNVGGQNFSFIVLSPQFKGWPSASDVNEVVDYAIRNYRVDQSRIYVTGLSMGGGATWEFAGAYPSKAAAVVPVCGAAGPDAGKAQAMVNAKLGVWATHNDGDPTVSVSNTTGWVAYLQQYGGDVQSTIFQSWGHDAWSRTYDPNFTQNGVNIYQWMLQHQRGGGSTPAPNQSPTVSAGANQSISLPQNSVTLSGSASDADGSIASYQWSQLSGPSSANINSPNSAATQVNNLVVGTYTFRLTATDNKGATATSDVNVEVSSPTNQPPLANAGQDQTIVLPQDNVTLTGSGTDSDGTISTYEWNQTSGPAQANIVTPNVATTLVNKLAQGSYVFTLKITDNKGATAISNVTITVNAAPPPPNQPPTVNAGSNQSITLPQNSVTLASSASDADGTVSSYEWTQTSGPSQTTITSPGSATTVVNNLVQGNYIFTLKVTDDKGATASGSLTITVNAAPNQPPLANAGVDQTITLPTNSATLSGSGSDPDGSVNVYEWSETQGPSQASIVSSHAPLTVVNNLIQGKYVFTLKITDDKGATATSNVTVTVNPAPNRPPVANAGGNQTITLPQNSVSLTGTGTDADGSIVSYQWTQTSGPSQANITTGTSAATTVNNLVRGSYIFTLKVTDNSGATATNNVTIKVNQVPLADAGKDRVVTLPTDFINISGTASDLDGSIASYEWRQITGPTKTNFSSAPPFSLTVNNLKPGVYIFRLVVIDNDGAAAWSDVKITVMPDPTKPSTAAVYPNPVTNNLYVKIDAVTLQSKSSIQITNSSGNVLYTEKFMRTNFTMVKQVDVSRLPSGIYFLTVVTDINNSKTLTFVKQ